MNKIGLKKKIDLKKKISTMMGMPKEILNNVPLITITGSEEMLIENYKGIVEYTNDNIRINTSTGTIKIEGKNLFLKHITSDDIKVLGVITRLEYMF